MTRLEDLVVKEVIIFILRQETVLSLSSDWHVSFLHVQLIHTKDSAVDQTGPNPRK